MKGQDKPWQVCLAAFPNCPLGLYNIKPKKTRAILAARPTLPLAALLEAFLLRWNG
ncbi:MAG TPA: hypothetical protein VL197_13065 [Nitrospirota bacterium]|nr:hypothetical protein [Nitrospirota bacterium]